MKKFRRVCRRCVCCDEPKRNLEFASVVRLRLVTAFDTGTDETYVYTGPVCPWCREWIPTATRTDRAWTMAEAVAMKNGVKLFHG